MHHRKMIVLVPPSADRNLDVEGYAWAIAMHLCRGGAGIGKGAGSTLPTLCLHGDRIVAVMPPFKRTTARQHMKANGPAHTSQNVTESGTGCPPASVFDLANDTKSLTGSDAEAFHRIFRLTYGKASCTVGEALGLKYNMERDNVQTVVSITNKWTMEQAWFNEVRSRKPQTFVGSTKPLDPTGGGGPGKCDFCTWQTLTAEDPWGRIESEHAVTASNLFKYGEPFHGLALFKCHDPLNFTLHQLSDLMAVSQAWFTSAAELYQTQQHSQHDSKQGIDNSSNGYGSTKEPLYGFVIWNCLARAGASQYHGHAQLMATRVPVPSQAMLDTQSCVYAQQHPGRTYIWDLLAAHRAAGLLRACAGSSEAASQLNQASDGNVISLNAQTLNRAWIAASLSPTKDMEMLIVIQLPRDQTAHDSTTLQANGNDGDDGANHNQQLPKHGLADSAFCKALHASLRALLDILGVEAFNVGVFNVPCQPNSKSSQQQANGGSTHSKNNGIERDQSKGSGYILAKVVSRGRMSQPASDFGCLEVLGGASIGHTDPYRVIVAVEQQLGDCMVAATLPSD